LVESVALLLSFTIISPGADAACERLGSGTADGEWRGILEAIAADLNPSAPDLIGTLVTNNNRPTDEVAVNNLRISA
jgi:hypothetical protein